MLKRAYRWRRHLLIAAAAFPLLQTTSCLDPASLSIQAGSSLAHSQAQGVISSFAGSILQVILTSFAGSGIIRAFLGGS